jgi:hypothetical protein
MAIGSYSVSKPTTVSSCPASVSDCREAHRLGGVFTTMTSADVLSGHLKPLCSATIMNAILGNDHSSRLFQRFHASSRAFLLASLASGASPAS